MTPLFILREILLCDKKKGHIQDIEKICILLKAIAVLTLQDTCRHVLLLLDIKLHRTCHNAVAGFLLLRQLIVTRAELGIGVECRIINSIRMGDIIRKPWMNVAYDMGVWYSHL